MTAWEGYLLWLHVQGQHQGPIANWLVALGVSFNFLDLGFGICQKRR